MGYILYIRCFLVVYATIYPSKAPYIHYIYIYLIRKYLKYDFFPQPRAKSYKYVMYIRVCRGVYATIYPRNRGIFSSEAAGRGRKNAEVEGVYCCIDHEKAPYIQYISHLEGSISSWKYCLIYPPFEGYMCIYISLGIYIYIYPAAAGYM